MHRSVMFCGVASLLMSLTGTLLALGVAFPHSAEAQGAVGSALPTGSDEHFAGSYLVNVMSAQGPFTSIATYAADGTMSSSNFSPNPGVTVTDLHGSWARTGEQTYAATAFRLTRDVDGNQSLHRLRQAFTLDATSGGYTGRQVDEILDADGNVVNTPGSTTFQATRINVVPIS